MFFLDNRYLNVAFSSGTLRPGRVGVTGIHRKIWRYRHSNYCLANTGAGSHTAVDSGPYTFCCAWKTVVTANNSRIGLMNVLSLERAHMRRPSPPSSFWRSFSPAPALPYQPPALRIMRFCYRNRRGSTNATCTALSDTGINPCCCLILVLVSLMPPSVVGGRMSVVSVVPQRAFTGVSLLCARCRLNAALPMDAPVHPHDRQLILQT